MGRNRNRPLGHGPGTPSRALTEAAEKAGLSAHEVEDLAKMVEASGTVLHSAACVAYNAKHGQAAETFECQCDAAPDTEVPGSLLQTEDDGSRRCWIAVHAAVCGGLAAANGLAASGAAISRLACDAADSAVVSYQNRVRDGAL